MPFTENMDRQRELGLSDAALARGSLERKFIALERNRELERRKRERH